MSKSLDRRQFLALAGMGGVVFASGLAGFAGEARAAKEDFFFVQITDTHWGYKGAANPEAHNTLQKAVAAANALEATPDFIVFTGDLTHTTDDAKERRRRLAEFRDIVAKLKVKDVKFMPGEHDAALDAGEAYREFFGKVYYTFDHKGVHFIALDNTTDKGASLGEEQLKWLAADLAQLDKAQPIVVLAHRPLYDLLPEWDWATRDGAKALALLKPFANVTFFYGHIHHEHHQTVDGKAHHAAASLIFPLARAGSQPKKGPVAWDPAAPFKGLGFRGIGAKAGTPALKLDEIYLKA
jgi:3',5'-cyclic AMP phosphodiesterase CpdA